MHRTVQVPVMTRARFAEITDPTQLYFAMARGTAAAPAMEMTKWFDTNYHYIVPELHAGQSFWLASTKTIDEFLEAEVAHRVELAACHRHVACDKCTAADGLDGRDGLVEIGPGRQGIGDGVEVGAAVDRDDVGALGGQRHRVGSALPARRAGDHCDAADEV